MAGEYSRKQCR